MDQAQNYSNHRRFVPGFHGVLFVLILAILAWSIKQLVSSFSAGTVIGLAAALSFALLFSYTRFFVMKVQDRVIRLEERLRMEALLPADLKSRINDFSIKQLVALRFASDGELPPLARKVLMENITDTNTIKQLIKDWRPDHARA